MPLLRKDAEFTVNHKPLVPYIANLAGNTIKKHFLSCRTLISNNITNLATDIFSSLTTLEEL